MCRFFWIYIWNIYVRNILWCIYWERSSGWSLRIILQHGGGGARSETRPLAPPPPCWRLILLDTQAQQYGGGCEVEEKDEVDLTKQSHVSGSGWYLKVRSSSFFSRCSFYPPLFFLPTSEGQTLTPTCCSSSLTKGTISEPHWFKASISWLCFPHPELLIGTLAIEIPRANKKAGGEEISRIFWILVKILVLRLLSSKFFCFLCQNFLNSRKQVSFHKNKTCLNLKCVLTLLSDFYVTLQCLCRVAHQENKLIHLLVSSSLLMYTTSIASCKLKQNHSVLIVLISGLEANKQHLKNVYFSFVF